MTEIDRNDFNLTPAQLAAKYTPADADERDGEHPVFTQWDWRQKVAQRSTVMGYWEWVEDKLDDHFPTYL